MILGFDPGRDKCGVAVMETNRQLHFHQVVDSAKAIAIVEQLCQQFPIELIVMGNQTTAKNWQQNIESSLSLSKPIALVYHHNRFR